MASGKGALRAAALSVVLGGLGVAAWWIARGSAGETGGRTALPQASAVAAEPQAEDAVVQAAPEEPARIAAPVAEAQEDAPAAVPVVPETLAATAPEEAAAIAIEGTIVVTGADSVEHPFESGSMVLVVWRGELGQHESVEIADGRWAATVAGDAALSFSDIALGGRRAAPESEEQVPIPPSRLVAVRARWPLDSFLRVRSAETQQDLSGIELVGDLGWESSEQQHPGRYGEGNVLARDASSPIDLGRALAGRGGEGLETLFARAPGTAWGRVQVDLDSGGERFLDLVAGGDLAVTVVGPATKGAELRVRKRGSFDPVLSFALLGKSEVELTGLEPGPFTLAVEVGEWFRKPVVLGSAPVEIQAGALAQATVAVEAPPEVATAPLKGLLVVDPGWGEIAPGLTVESIRRSADGQRFRKHFAAGDLAAVPGAVNTWTFDAGSVPLGKYQFAIDPPFCLLSYEVEAATGDVRLEVPAPAIAAVRTIDRDGAPVDDLTELNWNPKRPRGVSAGILKSASRDAATGRFEIRAPSGSIIVAVAGIEFRGGETYKLGPGRHEVDLVVTRSVGFTLTLRDGETLLPWPNDWWEVKARQVDGKGSTSSYGQQGGGLRVVVTRPGLYRFSLPAVDGYAPIPEQQVLVPERGFAEHVVELVRSP